MEVSKPKPRLGAAGIVRKEDKILLGIRNKDPARGKYILPGGRVEFGETLIDAVKREILEEANIIIEVEGLAPREPLEIISESEHRVIIYFKARYVSGELRGGDDLLDPKFFSRNQIRNMIEDGGISEVIAGVLKQYMEADL